MINSDKRSADGKNKFVGGDGDDDDDDDDWGGGNVSPTTAISWLVDVDTSGTCNSDDLIVVAVSSIC